MNLNLNESVSLYDVLNLIHSGGQQLMLNRELNLTGLLPSFVNHESEFGSVAKISYTDTCSLFYFCRVW